MTWMSLRGARSRAGAAVAALVMGTVVAAVPAAAGPAAAAQRDESGPVTFEVASFNVLGSNHTAGSTRWYSGPVRARMAKRWLAVEGTSVVGLQEGQVDQMKAFTRSGEWTSYPDPRQSRDTQTAQSVAWRTAEWSMVEARTFRIPFDRTQQREQPMVLLEHRATGRRTWVVSVHMTAGWDERAVWERRAGTRKLVRHVRELEAAGVPVIVTGDMNAHDDFFCHLAARTTLRSPAGGAFDGACVPPTAMRVDWIFGSPDILWADFRYADDAVLDKVTDHTVPVGTATLG